MADATPTQAVIRGHLTATFPSLLIIVAVILAARALLGPEAGITVGPVVGAMCAWLWWSFMVPRWRDWVIDRGLRPEDVQSTAVRTGLLWPRGSFPERTEFRRRGGTRGW